MKEEAKLQIARERTMKRVKTATWILIGIAVVISVVIYVDSIPPPPGKYDTFAKCIAASGAHFYGAFWCPHCANQKAEFGDSKQYLPYVECSLPDESGQTQICIDHNITTYPTWIFADGSTSTGETSLETLSAKTNCPLPGEAAAAASSSIATSSGAGTVVTSTAPQVVVPVPKTPVNPTLQ